MIFAFLESSGRRELFQRFMFKKFVSFSSSFSMGNIGSALQNGSAEIDFFKTKMAATHLSLNPTQGCTSNLGDALENVFRILSAQPRNYSVCFALLCFSPKSESSGV